jgi:hypothetical protein
MISFVVTTFHHRKKRFDSPREHPKRSCLSGDSRTSSPCSSARWFRPIVSAMAVLSMSSMTWRANAFFTDYFNILSLRVNNGFWQQHDSSRVRTKKSSERKNVEHDGLFVNEKMLGFRDSSSTRKHNLNKKTQNENITISVSCFSLKHFNWLQCT